MTLEAPQGSGSWFPAGAVSPASLMLAAWAAEVGWRGPWGAAGG